MRRPKKVPPRQRQVLREIRTRLGDKGYWIWEVSKRYRRTSLDFAVFKLKTPGHLVLIRPGVSKGIDAKPFCPPYLAYEVQALLLQITGCWLVPMDWKDQFLPSNKKLEWRQFITPAAQKRYDLLTKIENPAA